MTSELSVPTVSLILRLIEEIMCLIPAMSGLHFMQHLCWQFGQLVLFLALIMHGADGNSVVRGREVADSLRILLG